MPKIKISWDEGETFDRVCDLRDAFCIWDEDGYQAALNEIQRHGRCWVGGGREPAALIVLCGPMFN